MSLPAIRPGPFVSALVAAALATTASATPPPGQAGSGPAPGRHVKATLVAETDAVAPGQTLVVGIRLQMDAGWHTYWRNPGDSGLPTRVRWTLPDGFVAGDLQWPAPARFPTGPIVSYGYSGEVVLSVEVRVPAGLAGKEARLAARVDWLECQEACLPGRAELTLTLPVRAAPQPGPAAPLFAATRRAVPAPATAWRLTASADPSGLALAWLPPVGEDLPELTSPDRIDDKPSTDVADVATARNYVAVALAEVTADRPVAVVSWSRARPGRRRGRWRRPSGRPPSGSCASRGAAPS